MSASPPEVLRLIQLRINRTPVSSLPKQCEQPATTSASDSDSSCNSAQSSEPGIEPEDTEPEDWRDDLVVALTGEEADQLLQEMEEEAPPPLLSSTSEGPGRIMAPAIGT